MNEVPYMSRAPSPPPQTDAHRAAGQFFGLSDDPAHNRRILRGFLISAGGVWLIIPLLWWLNTGEPFGSLGLGLTVFLSVYCLLVALGIYVKDKPDFWTSVPVRRDWLDMVGAWWAVVCVFGPLFGWIFTAFPTLTLENWTWLYGGRAVLAAALPVLFGLPLLRYARGKATLVMLAILVGVTGLAIASAWNILGDLAGGPVVYESGVFLPYTRVWLSGGG
jgi:hypothetical protein